MTTNPIPTAYIPLEKFHIVPVTGLSPADLKASAKKTSQDREKISHTTKLNAIAKRLGVTGGFAAYESQYIGSLLPFMAKHNLKKRKDLLKHSIKGEYDFCLPFNHQQVSERLFFLEGPMPQKLFTGHDFDFTGPLSWNSSDLSDALGEDHDWYEIIFGNYHIERAVNENIDISGLPERQQKLLEIDVTSEITLRLVDQSGLLNFFEHIEEDAKHAKSVKRYKQVSVKIVDLILLKNRNYISSVYHLLGNTLTDNAEITTIFQSYSSRDTPQNEVERCLRTNKYLQQLLALRLREGNEGWVKVLPFNDNLIFLADEQGNYDFVIRNQRNKKFSHEIFGDKLKRADIPSCIEDYRFERWHYFEYEGNRDWDSHCSEIHFYQNGGLMQNYPGSPTILRVYYQFKEIYKPERKTSSVPLRGFSKVSLNEKDMMVSQLITIDELIDFLKQNPDYNNSRQGDSLAPINSDRDTALPASCTFYDVLAYLNWFEKKTKVPVRLLTYPEYKLLRGKNSSPANVERYSDMVFFNDFGEEYPSHPPYMPEQDFDNLHLRFPKSFRLLEENGLQFVNSDFFCEWLLEGAQIRSASLKSFYRDNYVLRARGPASSTGKYKGMKTGFRLCYELKKH